MASTPHKVVRFLVWSSVGREQRDDALTALDEGFDIAESKFGLIYAHMWAYGQAVRSLPCGIMAAIIKIGSAIWKLGS